MNITNFGKGAVRDLNPDPRNYKLEKILGVGYLTPFDWSVGFDVEDKTGLLKRENQNGSLSCVAQSWSKYQEALEAIEGYPVDLSAKDIYSRIFQPQGGALIQDGAKLLVKRGVCLETSNPSYIGTTPPTEAYMRELVPSSDQEATIYGDKSYATTTHNSIEFLAQMIRDNNGVVSGFVGSNEGWQAADVRPPKDGEVKWGHAVYLKGACMRNGRQAIKFLNSWGKEWGENGVGYFYADYVSDNMFDIFTLIDKVNPLNKTMKIIKEISKPDQFALGTDGKRRLIYNLETLSELHNAGAVDRNSVSEVPDISIYPRADDLIAINPE